jgi:hypothetical protein
MLNKSAQPTSQNDAHLNKIGMPIPYKGNRLIDFTDFIHNSQFSQR